MVFVAPCAGTYGPRPKLVNAPVYVPWRFGLLSAANYIPVGDDHELNGIAYKSPPCSADVQPWVDDCDSGAVLDKPITDLDRDAIVRGCPFHLVAQLSCKTTTLAAMRAEVREVFGLGVQRAIEEQVWLRVLAVPASLLLNVDATPANALGVVAGIAALESHMAACYGGQATLHGDRALAPYMARDRQLMLRGDSAYETVLGSRMAFYSGGANLGPDGTPAPAGFAWLYATSLLTLRHSEVVVYPDSDDQIISYSPMTNEPRILAEQTFIPSVECCQAAVLVCLGTCD